MAVFSLALAVPTGVQAAAPLDIDGNGVIDAATDGLLLMRYLFRVRGAQLVENAVGVGATRSTAQIEAYLGNLMVPASTLDIDSNGRIDALTDGLLIYRYMLGMRGTALVTGALGTGATRISPTEIQNYIANLLVTQSQGGPTGC